MRAVNHDADVAVAEEADCDACGQAAQLRPDRHTKRIMAAAAEIGDEQAGDEDAAPSMPTESLIGDLFQGPVQGYDLETHMGHQPHHCCQDQCGDVG